MKNQVALHPDLAAALSIVPESQRAVPLRGHDVTFYPIEVGDYCIAMLQDQDACMVGFGVDITTGERATPEQIAKAREDMSGSTAAKLIALSARIPALEKLADNLTPSEKARCLAAAFAVTTGGDVAGFFADVNAHLSMTVRLLSLQSNAREQMSAAAAGSGKATQSPNSLKQSRTSKRK